MILACNQWEIIKKMLKCTESSFFFRKGIFWKVLMSFSRFNNLPARTETTMTMICMPEFHPAGPEQIGRQEKPNPQILRRSSTPLSNTTGTIKPSMKIWERSIVTLLWGEKQNRFQTFNLFLCYITCMIWFSYWGLWSTPAVLYSHFISDYVGPQTRCCEG